MNANEHEAIRIYDPAIEPFDPVTARGTKIAEYATHRRPEDLVFRAGARPRVFVFRRLARYAWRTLEAARSEYHRREVAFRHGLIRVVEASGHEWRPSSPLTSEELERFEPVDVNEIGGVILTRSQVPLEYAPRYHISSASIAVWEAVVSAVSFPSAAPVPVEVRPPAPAQLTSEAVRLQALVDETELVERSMSDG